MSTTLRETLEQAAAILRLATDIRANYTRGRIVERHAISIESLSRRMMDTLADLSPSPAVEHTCHDMNPPHPYPCAACESDKLEGPAGGARKDAIVKSKQSIGNPSPAVEPPAPPVTSDPPFPSAEEFEQHHGTTREGSRMILPLWRWLCSDRSVIGSKLPGWTALHADRAAAATERLLLGACGPARPARDAEAIAAREARLRVDIC